MAKVDKELEQYRNLLKPPAQFEDGFSWTTIAGIFFCGLIMLPGSIYLGLMTGGTIAGAEAVSKSFPDFFERLRDLKIEMEIR